MNETEEYMNSASAKKEKIRQRYKGVDIDELDVIPALPQENFYEDKKDKRVAVYARVSTDDPRQTSSYELQKNHYLDVVDRHQGWQLVDIYADEGISGTSLQHRDAFIKMIKDCHEGKIDLIMTKSVSRFARNVLVCIGYVRKLAALQPPIGVFFETENIYTLNINSEMSLSFISTLAQEESHNKSEIMNASIEMRFRRGIFLTPPLLGYDNDEDGNLVINTEEAKTVKLIFFMYLYGYTCQQIAEALTSLGRNTKKKSILWSPSSVLNVLQNERHCGDVLARKTWTPSYLNHKSKKNKQDRNQYRQKNHHEAIISRDDFIAVQHLISNAKYRNKCILPELHVVPEGALCGFVSINLRWAGFTAHDYFLASGSVCRENEPKSDELSFTIEAKEGDFDLRGFEIARSQFFNTKRRTCVTFSIEQLQFSTECLRKLNNALYIEMLIHPREHLLAIRIASKKTNNSVQWAKISSNSTYVSRPIAGASFLKTIYEMFNWNYLCKYRISGIRRQKGDEMVLIFDMKDTEIFIPKETVITEASSKDALCTNISKPIFSTSKSMLGFPCEWIDGFGKNYYRHAQASEIATFNETGEWNIQMEGISFSEGSKLQVTNQDEIAIIIDQIMAEIRQENANE